MSEAVKEQVPVKEVAALSINSNSPANGTVKPPECSSPAPTSAESGSASFKDQFKLFSKFGDVKSDGKFITLSQSDKWMKQAQVYLKNSFAIFIRLITIVFMARLLTKKSQLPILGFILKN